jgi:hypothetical protein
MDKTKTSGTNQYHAHAVGAAALLILQKTLETLVKHGIITSEQLTEIYESARREHEDKRPAFREVAVHGQIGDHIRHAAEGHWPPDDIQ